MKNGSKGFREEREKQMVFGKETNWNQEEFGMTDQSFSSEIKVERRRKQIVSFWARTVVKEEFRSGWVSLLKPSDNGFESDLL